MFPQDNPLANVKKVDCALLPPCLRSLEMKIRHIMYVARLWMCAWRAFPGENLSPADYGWALEENVAVRVWFEGPAIPDKLFTAQSQMKSGVKTVMLKR